jgi:2-hydroxychromene-2-carboxylate isomerase
MENSPFVLQKEKGAYVQQDMARLCRKYGLAPWVKPSVFPRLGVLPLRIALLGVDQPWIGAFCRKVMELNFVHAQDINQREQMAPVVAELGLSTWVLWTGLNPSLSRRGSASRQSKPVPRASSVRRPLFVGKEMFWGNDRLDDALLLATEQKA